MKYINFLILSLLRVSREALGTEFRANFQSICIILGSAIPEVPKNEKL